VEMVLVLPLLVLLIFGIISFGLYINASNTIQQAVRDGARTAAIGDTLGCPGDLASTQLANNQSPTVYGAVDQQIASDGPWLTIASGSGFKPLISFAAIVSTTQSSSGPSQDEVVITVAYPYKPLLAIPGILPGSLVIAATYEMMVQVPQPADAFPPNQSSPPSGPPYYETTQYTNPLPTGQVSYFIQPPPSGSSSPCS
jgi:Flp pilus assembly protein TadG